MKKAKCIGLVTTKSEILSLYVTAYHNCYSRSFPQWLLIFSLSAMLSKSERRERVFPVQNILFSMSAHPCALVYFKLLSA